MEKVKRKETKKDYIEKLPEREVLEEYICKT